jgi:hypothetical protein
MNILSKKLIESLFEYLDNNDSFRQCSKRISLIIGKLYFSKIDIKSNKIVKNHFFRKFVKKYNFSINVINVKTPLELAYLNTYNIKSIIIDDAYMHKYFDNLLPSNVEVLYLFNHIHEQIILPSSLKVLYLELFKMPKATKTIDIGILNENIESPNYTNNIIMPNTLEELLITTNNPINILPTSLLKLTISGKFNYKLNNILPQTLQELDLSASKFNYNIEKNTLPSSLKKLYMPLDYRCKINELPASLIIFHTGNNSIEKILPPSLQELNLNNNIILQENDLPPNLKKIKLGDNYDKRIKRNILPESLEELTFGYSFNQPLDEHILPKNIKKLIFGYEFNHFIKRNVLPNKLEELKFGFAYNKTLYAGVLPCTLKIIEFGCMYNKLIGENILPPYLKSLLFGNNYNHQFYENVLPQSLKELTVGMHYSKPFLENILPKDLEHLTVGDYYKNVIVAPKSIKTIKKKFHETDWNEEMNIII